MHPYQERCDFIHKTKECHAGVQYFDYLEFIFCTIGAYGPDLYIAGLPIVLTVCLYLFTILATTADKL